MKTQTLHTVLMGYISPALSHCRDSNRGLNWSGMTKLSRTWWCCCLKLLWSLVSLLRKLRSTPTSSMSWLGDLRYRWQSVLSGILANLIAIFLKSHVFAFKSLVKGWRWHQRSLELLFLMGVPGHGSTVVETPLRSPGPSERHCAKEHCRGDAPEKPRSSVASLWFQSKPGLAFTHLAVYSHLKNLFYQILVP